MDNRQDVLREFRIRHLLLADVAAALCEHYVSAIREYGRKQEYDKYADISYGYAMGYYSALCQLEGIREREWQKRQSKLAEVEGRKP